MNGYAELAVTTNFSFLRGASGPDEQVRMAKALKLSAIGIADRNTLAGVVRAYSAFQKLKANAKKRKCADGRKEELELRLLIGTRLCFADGTPDILAYPADFDAYRNLCRLLTKGKMAAEKADCILSFPDLTEFQQGLLLVLMPGEEEPQKLHSTLLDLMAFASGRIWLAAAMPYHGEDEERLSALCTVARIAGVPLLAVNDALYHKPKRKPLQDVVTCIREHMTLDSAGRKLKANAERYLKSSLAMTRLFQDAPEAIAETLRFAERISFTLEDVKKNWRYPDEPVPPGKTAQKFLEELTWEKANKRYLFGIPEKIQKILEKELKLIEKLGYADYFLTVHEIVRFAREGKKKEGKDPRPILCQGRGSAANSAVCFVLGVTSVDPEESDLLVERFMSEERKEPPDIDVDFEHARREEVIQDVFERYGRHRAALTATVISYRPRSAIREVGKVFGLTEDVTAALAGTVWGSWGESIENKQVRQASYDSGNSVIARAVDLTNQLIGFPRHLSQHVGGFVLTKGRLDELIPIGNAAMQDRTFIEWDKDDIDTLGIMKVDVLALGMLTCIRKAFDLIDKYSGDDPLELATVPREDKAVYDMLTKADSIGVFQVESRAQMSMLPRLKPKTFYDLVIEVAIVRPGPIEGDMVNPYLKRRSGLEAVVYPAPSPEHGPADEMKGVLGRTMGVPLFQEQAMRLAIVAAQFTADEANGLRRAMATFRNVGTIYQFQTKFIEGMVKRGYERGFAERCFKQIEGFGSYGFPESHAASFAQLAYISAWLKCHHPAAFACALLNSQPMGFYAPAEIVRDAREHGVTVHAPDIHASEWDNTLVTENGVPALQLGFRQIDGMSEEIAGRIVGIRGNGFFDLGDLKRRAKIPQRALMILAEADSFRSLELDRREALWAARRIPNAPALPLFGDEEEMPPDKTAPLPVMQLSEHVLADYQSIRLSLKGHPMQFLRKDFTQEGTLSCADIGRGNDKAEAVCAGIVLVRQQPGTAKGTVFVTLSDETGITNVVVWPNVMKRYRKEVMGARLLQVEGRIQRSPDNVVHLVAERMTDRSGEILRLSDSFPKAPHPEHNARRHPRNVRVLPKSRDFH